MDGAEPTPFLKKSLRNFKKGLDKPQGLWYNKDSQGAVAQESRGVHTSVSRGSKPLEYAQ
jgi:hypothetical protein